MREMPLILVRGGESFKPDQISVMFQLDANARVLLGSRSGSRELDLNFFT